MNFFVSSRGAGESVAVKAHGGGQTCGRYTTWCRGCPPAARWRLHFSCIVRCVQM